MNYSEKLNNLIPGGCHTYSRGDDQFPSNAPEILEKGKDSYVWSPDGRKFLDYGMGLRSVTVGYSNKKINKAVYSAIKKGNNLTRASTVELKAAQKLIDLIPSAEMVKFAKNGSNVTTAAVKLARAYSGKKYILRCRDNPFFSFDDWFIGDTNIKRGIPESTSSLTINFDFNNVKSVEKIIEDERYKDNIAAIILEPCPTVGPVETRYGNFLQFLRKVCDDNKIVLIFDEIVTGFRIHNFTAKEKYNVTPDLTTFGKAMANGFSVAALCGNKKIMDLGGIKERKLERTFLLSSTYGAEMSSLAAFLETMKIYSNEGVFEHITSYGSRLISIGNEIAKSLDIDDYFYFDGFPQSPFYVTKNIKKKNCYVMRTIFNQEMINNGVLMPWVALSLSHRKKEFNTTVKSLKKSLHVYKKALENPERFLLEKHVQMPVFRKYN